MRLPDAIGKHIESATNASDRYVNFLLTKTMLDEERRARFAVHTNNVVATLADAAEALKQGRILDGPSLIRFGSGVIGAIDVLPLFRDNDGRSRLGAGDKGAVDPDTRIITRSNLIVATSQYGEIKIMGCAVNPDEDRWAADELGVADWHKTNEAGIIVVPAGCLDVSTHRVNISDLDTTNGTVPIHRVI